MSTKELRVVPVMMHIEPSLHEVLVAELDINNESASNYMRGVLVAYLRERGKLDENLLAKLVGSH